MTTDSMNLVIGQSPRMRQTSRLIEKLGACRWPALLLGETGTGKEVVARSIHSIRGIGPFVTIDCSSLVGPLMESELFGYAKGAFTGANNTKIGLIEMAHGGTAFFDEIGELPLDLQAKLLRVLQQKEFRPVGSLSERKSDFRIIAATNRDLAKEVERGTFRSDLYYRLSVVNLRLPSLRERKEDIPALLAHFLGKYGRNHTLTQETVEALLSYDWPGNVRELENCVQHMVAINSGPLLHLPDLPSSLQNHMMAKRAHSFAATASPGAGASATPRSTAPAVESTAALAAALADAASPTAARKPAAGEPPILPLTEVEKRAIIEALDYTRGDRMMAAHLLGIGRTTLYRKLKEYQLPC